MLAYLRRNGKHNLAAPPSASQVGHGIEAPTLRATMGEETTGNARTHHAPPPPPRPTPAPLAISITGGPAWGPAVPLRSPKRVSRWASLRADLGLVRHVVAHWAGWNRTRVVPGGFQCVGCGRVTRWALGAGGGSVEARAASWKRAQDELQAKRRRNTDPPAGGDPGQGGAHGV
jgi:hypothetical protein